MPIPNSSCLSRRHDYRTSESDAIVNTAKQGTNSLSHSPFLMKITLASPSGLDNIEEHAKLLSLPPVFVLVPYKCHIIDLHSEY